MEVKSGTTSPMLAWNMRLALISFGRVLSSEYLARYCYFLALSPSPNRTVRK